MNNLARRTVKGAGLLAQVRPVIERLDALNVDSVGYFGKLLDRLNACANRAEAEALLSSGVRRLEDMTDAELEAILAETRRNLPPLPDDQLDAIFGASGGANDER